MKSAYLASLIKYPARWRMPGTRLALAAILLCNAVIGLAANPTLLISQVPLSITIPSHPQVLIAIGNSQSMDGDLSGAIMTGSGLLSSGLVSLYNSSSPTSYPTPAGFTPPVQAANSAGYAAYTVNQSGMLVDNGASRLNVAKQGIQAILQAYMQNTNFALEDYSTSGASKYTTWVYYMSPQTSGFTFTSTQASGNRYVANPCYGYTTASSTVKSNCAAMASLYGASTLAGSLYMQIGASSDDPNINDVLYAGGLPGLFVEYNGPIPSTPYPPNYSLSNYNNGNVSISYHSSSPSGYAFGTSPTNAGYVPYSPQVMNVERGFGYYVASVNPGTGNLVVPMTSAGTTPTTSTVNAAIAKFTAYLNPETNSASSSEIKSLAYQSPMAGLLSEAQSYLGSLSSSSSGCSQKKYVVLISDGLPTLDLAGHAWPPLGSAAAAGYGVTATFNTNGSLAATNDQALTDAITQLKALQAAGINTYIIGLGAGVEPTVNPQAAATLTAMAVAGGTANYYPATNPTSLVNDLNNILISIQNGSLSTSAGAVNSTQLNAGSVSYQSSFNTSDTPYQDWTGNLLDRTLIPIGGGAFTETQIWSAQTLLDTLVTGSGWSNNRYIASWNPTLNSGAGLGAPFEWASLSAVQQADLQPSDSLGQSRLDYLRGDTALEVRNGGAFRNRSHILGDIVDSQSLYVGAPNGPYFTTSYFNFQTAEAARTPVVYAGANDGMLHAFNANNGNEMFAFVPNALFGNLIDLTSPLYNQSHRFFVDGSPNTGDVQFSSGAWHTLLVGGENAGGNSIYALDITNPQSLTSESLLASSVLWEFTDGDMGLSYSQPQIAPIAQTASSSATPQPMQSAVFFGNGYNSPNNNAVLYAINAQTGALISKINLCTAITGACNASTPEGLSTVAVGNAYGLAGVPITTVYAGDLQGNLWAIDVSSPAPAQWAVRLLFQARDASGNPQPITTPPQVTLNPNYPYSPGLYVLFGTGQLLTQGDLTNLQTQTAYGVWDDPGATTPFTRANLLAQTLTLVLASSTGLAQNTLVDTNNQVNWFSQFGWYDDLPTPGQRFVINSQIYDGSFLATLNTPPANLCSAGFTAMLLDVNYQNGGGSGLSASAAGGGSAPPAPAGSSYTSTALPLGFGNAVVVLGGGGGSTGGGPPSGYSPAPPGYVYVMITNPDGSHSWILVPVSQVPHAAWWQIQ